MQLDSRGVISQIIFYYIPLVFSVEITGLQKNALSLVTCLQSGVFDRATPICDEIRLRTSVQMSPLARHDGPHEKSILEWKIEAAKTSAGMHF